MGQVFTLTTGKDNINASTGGNTVDATELTFTAGDAINFGSTTGNVLSWTDSVDAGLVVTAVPTPVAVTGIETANFHSVGALDVAAADWTGLMSLSVISTSGIHGSDSIYSLVAAVSVTDTLSRNNPGPGLVVSGGSSITVDESNGAYTTPMGMNLAGNGATTSVSVTQTRTTGGDQNVVIGDGSSGLNNVLLNGLDANSVTIDYTAPGAQGPIAPTMILTIENVANGATVEFANIFGATPALSLSTSNISGTLELTDNGVFTSLNVTTGVGALSLVPDFPALTSYIINVPVTPGGALTLNNTLANQTLNVEAGLAAGGGVTLNQGAAAAGDNDTFNLVLGTPSTQGIDTSDYQSGVEFGGGTITASPTITATSAEQNGAAQVAFSATLTVTSVGSANYSFVGLLDNGRVTGASIGPVSSIASGARDFANIINFVSRQGSLGGITAKVDPSNHSEILLSAPADPGIISVYTDGLHLDNATLDVISHGANLVPATGTLTISGSGSQASQLKLSDGQGVIGVLHLAAGANEATIVQQIETVLSSAGFQNVANPGGGPEITYTYPNNAGAAPGPVTLSDNLPQVDTLSLAGAALRPEAGYSETLTAGGESFTYSANFYPIDGQTISASEVLTALASQINAQSGTTDVTASISGAGDLVLTGALGHSFTASQITETSLDEVGFQAITANGNQTIHVTSNGDGTGGNLTDIVDSALTNLVVTGPESLTIATSGGHSLTSIDTTGASGFINLVPVLGSEVATGLTVNFGDASIRGDFTYGVFNDGYIAGFLGAATAGYTDTITGGDGRDVIDGTPYGGNSDVTLGNGYDVVFINSGTHNSVTLGNSAFDEVYDYSSGVNTFSFGSGTEDYVQLTTGIDTVSFAGTAADLDLTQISAPSFAVPVTSQVSVSTSHLDVIYGLTQDSHISLSVHAASPDGLMTGLATNLAGVADEAVFAPGTYSASSHTFTYGASGPDALLTYDAANGTDGLDDMVSVVLVGAASEIAGSTIGTVFTTNQITLG